MVAAISTELEEFVQSELANGHFASREELIVAALQQMRDRKAAREERVRELIAECDATPGKDIVLHNEEEIKAYFEDIKASGRERLAKMRASS